MDGCLRRGERGLRGGWDVKRAFGNGDRRTENADIIF